MSVCTANISAILSEPSRRDDDSAEPPQPTSHQRLNDTKHRLLSPHKYFILSLHWLIDRKDYISNRLQGAPCQFCSASVSVHICARKIQLIFLRFQLKFSVIKLTTPFHFPVSVSVHSSAVELVIFGPCFPPEPILQGKIKTLSLHMSTGCQTHRTNESDSHIQDNPSVPHSAKVGLLLTVYL